MAFTVDFYNFAKAVNSTMRPAAGSAGLSASCVLKDGCSIYQPEIQLQLAISTTPLYNYAFIAAFDRYYFIDNWTFQDRLWTASMTCDVLASWKNMIGNSTQYILRAASGYDDLLIDTYYPCGVLPLTSEQAAGIWWNSDSYANGGCYVVSVVAGTDETDTLSNGVTYMIMNSAGFRHFCAAILDNSLTPYEDNAGTLANIGAAVSKMILNPFEYVKTVKWYPFTIPSELAVAARKVSAWKVGFWQFTAGSSDLIYRMPIAAYKEFTASFTITKHFLAASRGAWCNGSPYTDMQLYLPRLGPVPVDVNRIITDDTLYITLRIDLASGEAVYKIAAGLAASQTDPYILSTYTCSCGVDIPLAQDMITVSQAIDNLSGVASGAAALAAGGGIAAAGAAIGSLARMYEPHLSQLGANPASFYDLGGLGQVRLLYRFYTIADDDNVHAGRPLCKSYQINTLSNGGYMLIKDAHVELIDAFKPELELIEGYMNGGFYYE